MKEIYFISPALPKVNCGVGDHVANIVSSIKKIKKNVSMNIITSKSDEINSSFENYDSSKFFRLKSWTVSRFVKLLIQLKKSKNSKIFHYQYPIRYPVLRSIFFRIIPLSLIMRIFIRKEDQIFITIHEYYKLSLLVRILKLIELYFADRIFVVTTVDRNLLGKYFSGKIEFFQVGSNIKHDQQSNSTLPNESNNSIIFFGSIDPSKGIDCLSKVIDGLEHLSHRYTITMLGRFISYEYEQKFKDHFRDLIENDKIKLVDYIDNSEIGQFLQKFDIGLLPFSHGAAPNRSSLIALLCAGICVVTTYKKGVTPSYLEEGVNCILHEPDDAQGMIESISLLLDDENKLNAIKKNSKKLTKMFDWDIGARTIAKYYDKSL